MVGRRNLKSCLCKGIAALCSVCVVSICTCPAVSANMSGAFQKKTLFQQSVEYYQMGDYLRARRYLQHIIRHKPDYWPAHYQLANTYLKLNEHKLARKHYMECLYKKPDIKTCIACGKAVDHLNIVISQKQIKENSLPNKQSDKTKSKPELNDSYNKQITLRKYQKEKILRTAREEAQRIRKEAERELAELAKTSNWWVKNSRTGRIFVGIPSVVANQIREDADTRANRVLYMAEQRARGIRVPRKIEHERIIPSYPGTVKNSTSKHIRNYTPLQKAQ